MSLWVRYGKQTDNQPTDTGHYQPAPSWGSPKLSHGQFMPMPGMSLLFFFSVQLFVYAMGALDTFVMQACRRL
jgi:hypothetical protein